MEHLKSVGSAKVASTPDTSHWQWNFKLPTWSSSFPIVNIAFQHRPVHGVKIDSFQANKRCPAPKVGRKKSVMTLANPSVLGRGSCH